MSMFKKRLTIVLVLVLAIVLFYLFIRNMNTVTTAEFAKVIEASDHEITIINQSNRVTTVRLPAKISELIEINKEYFIVYEGLEWKQPMLLSISP